MSVYEDGYNAGVLRSEDDTYDVRWDFADAPKAGVFAALKRGFDDGFDGREPQP